MADQLPPFDLEAEKVLITGLLEDPSQIDAVEADLRPEDMYDPIHRDTLEAIYALRKDASPTDSATVCRRIKDCHGQARGSAAVRLLADLILHYPYCGDVLGHSGAIRTASQNRKLMADLERAAGLARLGQGDEARAIVDRVSRVDVAESRVLTVRELLEASAHRAKRDASEVEKWSTLHWELDGFIGGLRRGFSYVIGMFTNCGKSSWLIGVADEMLRGGHGVLIVTFEDDRSIYGDRLLARRALINANRLRDNELTSDEIERVDDVLLRAEDMPVYLDARGKSVEWVLPRIKTLVRRHGIKCLMIDFIQKVRRDAKAQDERIRMRNTFDDLSDCGKNLNCVTIIASQLTPTNDKPIPDEYSIRDCKDMANNADYIFIGYRPDKDVTQDGKVVAAAGSTIIKVAKAKMGQKKQVVMSWNSESACFDNHKKPAGTVHEIKLPGPRVGGFRKRTFTYNEDDLGAVADNVDDPRLPREPDLDSELNPDNF